jgi:cytochrome c oxidase cbb3-type subunit 4
LDLQTVYETARSLWALWLMLLFAGIVWWIYRPKNRKRFEDAAKIPFRDDNGG